MNSKLNISKLCIGNSFKQLSLREMMYAYYLSQAAWAGAKITMKQRSPESIKIFNLLLSFFRLHRDGKIKVGNVNPQNWGNLVNYAAMFFGNLGNYNSFTGTKFVPEIPKNEFIKLLPTSLVQQFNEISEVMYSSSPEQLGDYISNGGMTTYHSANITPEDAELAQRFMVSQKLNAENTRLLKRDLEKDYIITVASIQSPPPQVFEFEDKRFIIIKGDYSVELKEVNEHLKKAIGYTANLNQKGMLTNFIQSFETGNIDFHKAGQRIWIKDHSPNVETIIGFIESYEDPAGSRAEFEFMVALVDKKMSDRFQQLVANATKLLPLLPWSADFEKEKFQSPDFTSINVLTFATPGIPSGINLPNYDDIRGNEGFKNVSLANIIQASNSGSINNRIQFIPQQFQEVFGKYRTIAFEMQTGLHELLGHGSGKLLGPKDIENLNNPITGKPITTCYKDGETWSGLFGSLSNAAEECRAECISLYFSGHDIVHSIFNVGTPQDARQIHWISWYWMVWAGLKSLEVYSPDKQKWNQAHSQARFAILQVLLEAGGDLVKITESGPDGLEISLDQNKIDTNGFPAIRVFLEKLGVYKATADVQALTELFNKYSSPTELMLKYREIIIKGKRPRTIFVQPNVQIYQNGVRLVEYDLTPEGIIDSFLDRYK